MKSVINSMKWAALVGLACGFNGNSYEPIQAASGGPSLKTGLVLKQLPFRMGDPRQSAAPRIRNAEDASNQTSQNWSGYASIGQTFTGVAGSWVVPAVTGTSKNAYAATWVGLDGDSSETVEQTGTMQEWTQSGQVNYPWFEMYPGPMYEIEGAPVNVGDTITASVSYVGPVSTKQGRQTKTEQVFSLTISDFNTTSGALNWSVTVGPSTGTQNYTTIPSAARSSAEWIMEAPTSSDILPLADFGTDVFGGCVAATATTSGPIDSSSWTAEPITMQDPEGGESTPSGLVDSNTGSSFTVTWSPYTAVVTHGKH